MDNKAGTAVVMLNRHHTDPVGHVVQTASPMVGSLLSQHRPMVASQLRDMADNPVMQCPMVVIIQV